MRRIVKMSNATAIAMPMMAAMKPGHSVSASAGNRNVSMAATDHITPAATALLAKRSARNPQPWRKDFTGASISKVIS